MKENENVKAEEITGASKDSIKAQIRCLIANVYDLQKLRISAGNRLVQSFYLQLGVAPSTSPDDVDKDSKKLIDLLKWEYTRISDAVVEKNKTVKSAIKMLNSSKNEEDCLKYIRNDQDYKLIESYTYLLKAEDESVKSLDAYVKKHPLWDGFFKNIKGCGTLMSAVCIAYLDPYVAKYPSSFIRYCGLDTVQDEDENGNKLYLEKIDGVVTNKKVREKYGYIGDEGYYHGKVVATDNLSDNGNILFKGADGNMYEQVQLTKVVNGETVPIYEEVETGEEYVGEIVVSQHGRRKGDTEMVEYTDADGNRKLKRSITYNPLVKTKLMGVLTGCLIKAKDPVYSKVYYDYKARLDNSSRYEGFTAGHKNTMAQRYMIKQFLKDLHKTWRGIEGLPIYETYEVGVLGHKPHHMTPEQEQERMAQGK